MSRVCKKCGGAVKMEDQFCMHCGRPLEKEEPAGDGFIKAEPAMYAYKDKEENFGESKAEVLSFWDYLLMLILLAIPVVNIIVCIIWIISGNGNPNRRNFAKAWLVTAVISAILSGLLAFGLFQFIVMDHPVDIHEHIEYSVPEQQFIDNFLMEMDET